MSPRPDLSDASDQQLVTWAREGREEAYGELLRRYQPSVIAFIYRIVRDHGLAEDLTQETFVKAFNALDSQRPESKFEAWIFGIANHAAVDYLRRKRLDTLSLDTSLDTTSSGRIKAAAIQVANPSASPTPDSDERRTAAEIREAIGRLRGHYRRCMMLRYVEERSYEDIAEILGLPLNSVKGYMNRARKQLKKMLGSPLDSSPSDSTPTPA